MPTANLPLQLPLPTTILPITRVTCTIAHDHAVNYTGMLIRRGQRGLEAKIFGLGFIASGLVLIQRWPRSYEGCPRGLAASHQNHVIYVTFFCDRKLLLAL